MSQTRRLAAIFAADVAAYSRLIGTDEGGTLQGFKAIRAELVDPTIAAHHGRLVKTTGDGLLVEFSSVVDALRCGVEVQHEVAERNAKITPDRRIEFRICINVGDVVVEDGDIFGTVSMSRRGSKGWRSPAGFVSRHGCRRTRRASSTSPSGIWASGHSRTLCTLCGCIGWRRSEVPR